jgi:hypothetical protein
MNTQFINAEVALAENGMTDLSLTTSAPMSALELPYHTDDAWEEWINECLVPADMQGVGMSANANLETLLASIGQSEDWFAAMVSGGPYHPRPA